MYLPLSLYIHIPFCQKKCLYCDFPSFSPKENEMALYTKKLIEEIEASASQVKNYEVQTIFFGGGTPTLLSISQLKSITTAIYKNYRIAKNVEFTIEANPKTFDEEKATALFQMGFRRMSIGLQSFQNEELQLLGRIHTKEDFQTSYGLARKSGFSNINIDLMFALPNQTEAMWQNTLKNAIALQPEHISVYSLIYEEGTPFFEKREQEELKELDEVLDRKLYHMAVELLETHGYVQYEISNFAKIGKESQHNITYWKTKPYLGFGLSAHSYFEGERFHNTDDFHVYINDPLHKITKQDVELILEKEAMSEFVFLGLRMTKGIAKAEFHERFGMELNNVYATEIQKCIKNELLVETTTHIHLTKLGIDLSNTVFCEFV